METVTSPGMIAKNTKQLGFSLSVYQIIGIVIIFTIVAAIVSFSKDLLAFDLSNMLTFWRGLPAPINTRDSPATVSPRSGPADLDYQNSQKQNPEIAASAFTNTPSSAIQSWCLVGEDMAGRWCVQVGGKNACDPGRMYTSKNECENSRS